MKTTVAIFGVMTAVTQLIQSAPRLTISTPSLAPNSEANVVFDEPMAGENVLGKEVENGLVLIQPELPAKLYWKAPTIAELRFSQAPALGTEYRFSIAKGSRSLSGNAVASDEFAKVETEALAILNASVQNRWGSDYSPETASWIVVLNDDVNVASVAKFIGYEMSGGKKVAAEVRHATAQEAGYYRTSYVKWANRKTPEKQAEPADANAFVKNILVVIPKTPLPIGNAWNLKFSKGLPNAAKSASLKDDLVYQVGNIEAFRVTGVQGDVSVHEPRSIGIYFNRKLSEGFRDEFVTVTPRVENMSVEFEGKLLNLKGDFNRHDKYTVTISNQVEGAGGVRLTNAGEFLVEFKRLEAELGLPSEDEAQYAHGLRRYQISTINLAKVQVRVKKLDGKGVVRALQGYRNYTGRGPDYTQMEPISLLPYSLVPGETIVEKEFILDNAIDTAEMLEFAWDELLPKDTQYATLFVDVVGIPKEGVAEKRKRGAQAIVQLTDIGLAWKFTQEAAMVYAFSCDSGKPMGGVKLGVYGEDASLIAEAVTDADGIAMLPRRDGARHLRAVNAEDAYAVAYDNTLDTVSLWYFPVRYSWMKPLPKERRVFMFTERSLYRPGEKVRIKGILRDMVGNDIGMSKAAPARIVITNPREKEIHSEEVVISKNGSFDLEYILPEAETGEHRISLQFPDDLRKAEETEDWELQYALQENGSFSIPLQVEEFRRNTYEIMQNIDKPANGAAEVKAKLTATYYQGQPVAAGKASVFTEITDVNPYPERFREFLFGDHRVDDWRYWYHYFGYRDRETENEVTSTSFDSELTLTQEGYGEVLVNLPSSDFPVGKQVRVATEVTDANDQTLTARSHVTVHPAGIYAGISRQDRLMRAGEKTTFRFVAITPEGEPYSGDAKMTVKVTRQVHTTTKTTNADGDTVTESDPNDELVFEREIVVSAGHSAKEGLEFSFTPSDTGLHFIQLSGVDAEGKSYSSVIRFHVYGKDQYPWEYEDGLRIKLVSEKKSYKPGDTARVLVLSPIEGKALVTIEREKVLSHYLKDISMENPVIEIPLEEGHAPNVYVSVLIVKGASQSAREVKEPQLRLGYCELLVENQRDRLQVDMEQPTGSYRPGTEVVLAGAVKTSDGKAAAGAEVTLYAVDEGTLSVMGYDTPDPMAYFYEPRRLSVDSGISFHRFLTENSEYRSFFNKGFFIGGGGDLNKLADLFRKNFDPCAAWAPTLETDEKGNFSYRFKLPDTLTRYRVIAIAHEGGARFGHGESSFVVNKPIMLEPRLPRFAHQGDKVVSQVMIQNASGYSGAWEVTCAVEREEGSQLAVVEGAAIQKVSLENGGSAVLSFPLRIDDTGEVSVSYQARPLSLSGRELSGELEETLRDGVKESFESHYPMPLLRQVESVHIKANAPMSMREMLSENLRDASGSVELDMSTSPLVDMGSSVEYLLHYPYGCAEQTSSSLMPWFAVKTLRAYVPAFGRKTDEQVDHAIRGGVSRLLSMQLSNGSFAYWPGAQETNDWVTPYAGMALVLAAKSGAEVPVSALDTLSEYLISSLRGIGEAKLSYELENHARALYTLALLGKAQPSYHSLMMEKLPNLSTNGRALLAAAVAMSAEGKQRQLKAAQDILESKVAYKPLEHGGYWSPGSPDTATELIAWLEIDPKGKKVEDVVNRMINNRNPYGHWDSTWMNGWNLLAISKYAEKRLGTNDAVTFIVETDGGEKQFVLSANKPSESITIALDDTKMKVRASGDAYLRMKVAGKPPLSPLSPVASNGLQIERIYEKVLPNGQVEILAKPNKGDLIRVTLRVTLPDDDSRYLVIDDPLPSTFETVNSKFTTQSSAQNIKTSENEWNVSHSELRSDRAAFFLDYVWRKGTYNITYLARCTMSGDVMVPPAKVELMYDPEKFALSASDRFESQ